MTHKKSLKLVILIYFIFLHLFTGAFIGAVMTNNSYVASIRTALGLEKSVTHVQRMLKFHQWADESVPDNATIFLGDSITQGLATSAIAPYSVNYGIGSENAAQLIDALPTYKSLARANMIVLEIGINDLRQGMKTGLKDRYQKIVDMLPSKTTLVWNAVMPARSEKIALSDIKEANQAIKSLCTSRGNCVFIDTWKSLADKNGRIIERYFLNDGIHLSSDGYRIWIYELKQALQGA